MNAPWLPVAGLDPDAFADFRRRAIFDCCKWDPQVGDVNVLARAPLVISPATWNELAAHAERLAAEAAEAEAELVERRDLHNQLGLPWAIRQALHESKTTPTVGIARIIRFDFHHTTEGWRISEANTDVPGGLNEASGFPRALARHYPTLCSVGDPAEAYVRAIAAAATSPVALVHATAYTDDQQMMQFLRDRCRRHGLDARLASPAQLRWRDGHAWLETSAWQGRLGGLVRFFPAEWLSALPMTAGWRHWFSGGATPVSNPATALLVQTKRFPLVWSALRSPLTTWKTLLPETREVDDVRWKDSEEWVVKPALGRVGEGVGIRGVTDDKDWRSILKGLRRHPRHWIAQRRFESTSLERNGRMAYPCVGVYTVDGRASGAYGRLAARPLVDARAEDAAVMVAA